MSCIRKLAGACLAVALCAHAADDKKDEKKKESPNITATIPFALIVGTTNSFMVRGQNLTNATALRFVANENLVAEIKRRGPAPASDKDKKVSETQLEVELALPADFPVGDLSFVVTTPDGETGTNRLRVLPHVEVFDEKEPNGGFRAANTITVPGAIRGRIELAADVDVFRFEARAGEKLRVESFSKRYGSPLDPILTLHDAKGHTLLTRDDSPVGTDCALDFTAPKDGTYFLSVQDAHDRGGESCNYLLVVRRE